MTLFSNLSVNLRNFLYSVPSKPPHNSLISLALQKIPHLNWKLNLVSSEISGWTDTA